MNTRLPGPRVYTSQQILDSWERFQAERSLAYYGHGRQDDLHLR
jgi:hypothetical protein